MGKLEQPLGEGGPTYRFELLHRPTPDVEVGAKAIVTFKFFGTVRKETMEYMGNGRWLPLALAEWLK